MNFVHLKQSLIFNKGASEWRYDTQHSGIQHNGSVIVLNVANNPLLLSVLAPSKFLKCRFNKRLELNFWRVTTCLKMSHQNFHHLSLGLKI